LSSALVPKNKEFPILCFSRILVPQGGTGPTAPHPASTAEAYGEGGLIARKNNQQL